MLISEVLPLEYPVPTLCKTTNRSPNNKILRWCINVQGILRYGGIYIWKHICIKSTLALVEIWSYFSFRIYVINKLWWNMILDFLLFCLSSIILEDLTIFIIRVPLRNKMIRQNTSLAILSKAYQMINWTYSMTKIATWSLYDARLSSCLPILTRNL